MELDEAIRTRRTHKAFGSDPVPREMLDELIELARWAPNHHLTNPWRFRVLGKQSLERLKEVTGPEGASKLDRAPTLVAATVVRSEDELERQEDMCATACAVYAVLLGAHARGLAGYWRTPGVLFERRGLEALGVPPEEDFVALIHLGAPRQERRPPERLEREEILTYLD